MLLKREKLRIKAVKEFRKREKKLLGSVKDFNKNIFREDARQSRWSRPKIKMIRQGRTSVDEEKDVKISDLNRKGEKISQDFEETMRQHSFIHQDIAQRHGEITAKKNDKALFNLAIDQIKAYDKKSEQLHEMYDRQKKLAQDAIEELRRRRARIELAAEILQEAQQRRN